MPGVRLRNLVWAYPVATTFVVLGTGNHFLLDAVAGLALVAGSAWLVTRVQPLALVLTEERSRVARELAG
jgi:hypothetical protein